MNRKINWLFIVTLMVMAVISSCNRYDPESEFEAEPLDGGKSVIITNYIGTRWEIRIPSKIRNLPVTHIKNKAFFEKKLTNVTIPNSVTTIEDNAFENNQLTKVTIPESVVYLSGFNGNMLTELTIPHSVTSIGNAAFANNQLTSITIPDSITSIGNTAFANNQLTDVTIPDSITYIGNRAFTENQLTSVIIPHSGIEIESNAFSKNLLGGDFEFAINRNLTITITNYKGTSNDVKIPESIIGLPVTAIKGDSNGGNGIAFDGAFDGKGLTSVIIPNSVTSIGYRAFADNQLTNITIPNSVTSLWGTEFNGNHQLVSITIGANVSIASGSAFWESGSSNSFGQFYNNSGKQAGTYTRPYSYSKTWTKQ